MIDSGFDDFYNEYSEKINKIDDYKQEQDYDFLDLEDNCEIIYDKYFENDKIYNQSYKTKKESIIDDRYLEKKLYNKNYNGYIKSKIYDTKLKSKIIDLKLESIKNYVKQKNDIDLNNYNVKKLNLFIRIALNLGLDFRAEENKKIDKKILSGISDNELISVLNLENKGYYFKNNIKKLIENKLKENFQKNGMEFLSKLIENNVKINEKILLNIIYSNDIIKIIHANNNDLINKSIKEIIENKEFRLNLKNKYLSLDDNNFCKSDILIEMPELINEFNKNDIKYILKKINKIKNNNSNNSELLNKLENLEEVVKFKNKSIENENELSYVPKELNEKYNIIINYNINKEQKEKLILQYQINYDTIINTLNDSLSSYIKVDNDLKYEKIYNNKSAYEIMVETMDSIIEEQLKIKKLLNEDVVKKMQVNKNFISSRSL